MKKILLLSSYLVMYFTSQAQKNYQLNALIKYNNINFTQSANGIFGTSQDNKDETLNLGVEFSKNINSQSKFITSLIIPINKRTASYNFRTTEAKPNSFPQSFTSVNNYMHVNINFFAELNAFYDIELWSASDACCDNIQSNTSRTGNTLSLSLGGGISFYNANKDLVMTSSKSNYVPYSENRKSESFKKTNLVIDVKEQIFNASVALNYTVKNKKTGKPFLILTCGKQRYFESYFNINNNLNNSLIPLPGANKLSITSFGLKIPITK